MAHTLIYWHTHNAWAINQTYTLVLIITCGATTDWGQSSTHKYCTLDPQETSNVPWKSGSITNIIIARVHQRLLSWIDLRNIKYIQISYNIWLLWWQWHLKSFLVENEILFLTDAKSQGISSQRNDVYCRAFWVSTKKAIIFFSLYVSVRNKNI